MWWWTRIAFFPHQVCCVTCPPFPLLISPLRSTLLLSPSVVLFPFSLFSVFLCFTFYHCSFSYLLFFFLIYLLVSPFSSFNPSSLHLFSSVSFFSFYIHFFLLTFLSYSVFLFPSFLHSVSLLPPLPSFPFLFYTSITASYSSLIIFIRILPHPLSHHSPFTHPFPQFSCHLLWMSSFFCRFICDIKFT